MEKTLDRPRYTLPLKKQIDVPVIKVLTGVRRCGKTTIMNLLADHVRGERPDALVLSLNFESILGQSLETGTQLIEYVVQKAPDPTQRIYFFFDEIQQVQGWEKAVNALRVDYNCDIFLTGSNSQMLSGDLATHLAGRYVSFNIQPFSFAEFRDLHAASGKSEQELLSLYLTYGGFPMLKYFNFDREESLRYLSSVYDTAVLRDVIEHHRIRDIDIFNRILRYSIANVGRSFSANSLVKYLKSERRSVSVDTVINYLNFCVDAFLLSRVPRQDLRGKEILRAQEKYYVADHGLREALGVSNTADIELVLENIVYRELISRGYSVTVGRIGEREIDFVAKRHDRVEYYQVSYLMPEESTRNREFGALEAVADNYPKFVLTLDANDFSRNGVIHRNIVDFLLDSTGS